MKRTFFFEVACLFLEFCGQGPSASSFADSPFFEFVGGAFLAIFVAAACESGSAATRALSFSDCMHKHYFAFWSSYMLA